MKDVQIVRVTTRAQKKAFVQFPLKLYKNHPCFVPPLYSDEMAQFKKKHAYSDTCETVFFLAMQEKKVVGRMQGILQRQSNDLRGEKRVRFTRFDAVNDAKVAAALFAAVENWAREQGMDSVCGPLGYSDLEREGLLIEGFDQLSTFEEQYNYDYYPALLEACGYQKEIDWLEHRLRAPKEPNPMLGRVAEWQSARWSFPSCTWWIAPKCPSASTLTRIRTAFSIAWTNATRICLVPCHSPRT